MDLIMRNLSTGEEKVVDYDFDFNIGSDGQADFEVSVPLGAEVWDMFYVDNYTRDNEYCGFVISGSAQTTETHILVKGYTLRYYLWSSVIPLEGHTTPETFPGGSAADMILDFLQTYFKGPIPVYTDYVHDGQTSSAVSINRFDSVDTAIRKVCQSAGCVCIPRFERGDPTPAFDGGFGLSFTLRSPKTYHSRIDDGEVGGTGEAIIDTAFPQKVAVVAGGQGEQAARLIRVVYYDGSSWHVVNSTGNIPEGYSEYLLDYPNAENETELIRAAKEIALGFWNGSASMSASNLEMERGATIGDYVSLSGAVEHTAQISGMILRRENGVVTEEFTYSDTEAETATANVQTIEGLIIDDTLSSSSTNPVQNQVINAALTPVEVTTLQAGTNTNLGTHTHAWKIGKFCMVTLNMQVTNTISSGETLVSGLPQNSGSRVSFASCRGASAGIGMRIAANATTITADAGTTGKGWYDAFFIYIMA